MWRHDRKFKKTAIQNKIKTVHKLQRYMCIFVCKLAKNQSHLQINKNSQFRIRSDVHQSTDAILCICTAHE